jgi:hypothetical protein
MWESALFLQQDILASACFDLAFQNPGLWHDLWVSFGFSEFPTANKPRPTIVMRRHP